MENTIHGDIDVYYSSIVKKIKEIEGVTSDRQFALIIGMRPDSYANTKKRGTFPFEKVIDYCFKNNYSLDEVFDIKNPKKILESSSLDNESFVNIPLLEDDDSIRLPKESIKDILDNLHSLKAYIDNISNIFIINTELKKLEDRESFLVKIFDKLYIKDVSVDLDRNYKLTESDFEPIVIKESDFEKFEIIGKVEAIYKKL